MTKIAGIGVTKYWNDSILRSMAATIAARIRVITINRIIAVVGEPADSRCIDSLRFFSVINKCAEMNLIFKIDQG
jgi:hypothetical protein